MLDIDGSNDADTRLQNVRNVLPALFVLATFDVGVRQLVYYHDLRMDIQDSLQIHLLHFFPLIK